MQASKLKIDFSQFELLHYKTNKTFPNLYVSVIDVLVGINQQYVNARYIVSVPRTGFEPVSPSKIQGSTIELQRYKNIHSGIRTLRQLSEYPRCRPIPFDVLLVAFDLRHVSWACLF